MITEKFLKESVGKFAKCKSYKGDREICRVLFAAKDYFGMDEPELCFIDQFGFVIEATSIIEVVG